jgi:hypothetical protein
MPNKQTNDSFIQIATMVNGKKQPGRIGIDPPYGVFVEFKLLATGDEIFKGVTASLGSMGVWGKCETVFVVVEPEQKRVYFMREVSAWRELTDDEKITEHMSYFNYE